MNLIPRFTPARRALQLGWFGVRHGTEVFEKLNRKNLFLAKQFSNREIFCNVCGKQSKLWCTRRRQTPSLKRPGFPDSPE